MINLSVKQQRIISEITSEFQRINQEKESQVKGSMTNFLNDEQVEKLYSKEWAVKPDGAYINLYRDDFQNESAWEEICQQFDVPSYNTESIEVLYFGSKCFKN